MTLIYIGQAKRALKTPNKQPVITKHITSNEYNFDWSNKKPLVIEHKYRARLTSEMMHIKLNVILSILRVTPTLSVISMTISFLLTLFVTFLSYLFNICKSQCFQHLMRSTIVESLCD